MEGSWISAVLILPLLWLQYKFCKLFDVKQFGSPALSIHNTEFRNVILHASINGLSVAIVAILTYILPLISASGPWGMVIAALISAAITFFRKFAPATK